jgi:putative methionine-R-sulfoxide reductase with GAF domain
MHGSAQPDDRFPSTDAEDTTAGVNLTSSVGAGSDHSTGNRVLEEAELGSALQLLVERAQYITGATGTALALAQGEEMVCRASAGSSAPAVGARLQVRSGLTGESIARRQLLRCDNAETDPRVNLETCRALGIASIVVLPLLRRTGEIRGLLELFSDHPYAFEERDLIALERMADLTLTALDLAERRQSLAPTLRQEAERSQESPSAGSARSGPVIPIHSGFGEPPLGESGGESTSSSAPSPSSLPSLVSVPDAMRRVQKCAACGFPVSEGRVFCIDCERDRKDFEKQQREKEQGKIEQEKVKQGEGDMPSASAAAMPEEIVPAFLTNYAPAQESWFANHINLLAIIVLILGVLVAIVVFR